MVWNLTKQLLKFFGTKILHQIQKSTFWITKNLEIMRGNILKNIIQSIQRFIIGIVLNGKKLLQG